MTKIYWIGTPITNKCGVILFSIGFYEIFLNNILKKYVFKHLGRNAYKFFCGAKLIIIYLQNLFIILSFYLKQNVIQACD